MKPRHGHSRASGEKSVMYYIWQDMRKRCQNPNSKRYDRYGGRGIRVCERWLTFENFLADMGYRPTPQHTLDRINNDGNYEPSNCRWATREQQRRNQPSRMLWITHGGITLCRTEWEKRLGLGSGTLSKRLQRGMPLEQALKPRSTA